MGIQLKGEAGVLARLTSRRRKYAKAVIAGLQNAGEYLLDRSNYYVPIDKQDLIASGHVRKTGRGYGTKVDVVYDAPHATYVHERTDLRHGEVYNKHYAEDIAAGRTHARRPQEQAKYLERAANESHKELLAIIKASVLAAGGKR